MLKRLLNIFTIISFVAICAVVIYGQKIKKTASLPNSASTDQKSSATDFPDLISLVGQLAPQFIATDMNGTQVSIENLRGKIVVLNLWGTFCVPCVEEMPKLNALVEKYKDKEVVFLSAAADDKKTLDSFLLKHKFDYDVLPGSFGIIKQYAPKKKVISPADNPDSFIMMLPTHLVIDRDGIVTEHFWGYGKNTANKLAKIIDGLLAKKP